LKPTHAVARTDCINSSSKSEQEAIENIFAYLSLVVVPTGTKQPKCLLSKREYKPLMPKYATNTTKKTTSHWVKSSKNAVIFSQTLREPSKFQLQCNSWKNTLKIEVMPKLELILIITSKTCKKQIVSGVLFPTKTLWKYCGCLTQNLTKEILQT
jgi:hypothetical protein